MTRTKKTIKCFPLLIPVKAQWSPLYTYIIEAIQLTDVIENMCY